jgi:two-component system, OmpR family, sensor kinase
MSNDGVPAGAGPARAPALAPKWYDSLYWRLAGGLVTVLALMLAAQAALFLWMADEIAGTMPTRDPRRLAGLVASDVGAQLATDPALDLDEYLDDQYGHVFQTFLVLLRDGRVASNHADVPADLLDAIRAEADMREYVGRLRRFGDGGGRDGGPGDGWGRVDPRRGPRTPGVYAPILVSGAPAGRVAVLPGRPPFSRIVWEFGPTLALLGGGVLVVGTTLIALSMFVPVRRRLKHVQSATERLGAGDLKARAPETGADEVAAVARSFNRMADELAMRAHALEQSDRMRRQLLADVSHELMTPLTAMRGYIETLTMAELRIDETTTQRYLGIVMGETHRLERIVGDLLDLARLEGGGTAIDRQPVEVAALFERVAERHERELHARNIHLPIQVDPDARQVMGDPDRLEQALQNLAANALRHTPDGGTITLAARRVGDGVTLSVRDTGPGIAPEHLPLIFERFYKGDASRRASGGSGLGLSIVKAIVERHGGRIAARTDGGAVFEIVLPDRPAGLTES